MRSSDKSVNNSGDPVTSRRLQFIGRTSELAWLRRILDESLTGVPQLALVSGEPGIGKSRLLREFIQQAQELGVVAGSGRGYEGQSIPYLPWTELLRAILAQTPDIESETIFGKMVRPTKASQRLIYGLEGERSQLYVGVSDLVYEISMTKPLLLVIDDLHWADTPSVELLTHVVIVLRESAAYHRVPLMILVATRPLAPTHAVGRVLERLEREDCCDTMQLGGLDPHQVALVLRALGITRPSYQLTSAIHEATGGNPLFVKTVAQQLQRRGGIELQGGFAVSKLTPAELELPQDIVAAITDRLSSLSEPATELLRLAAFLGDRIELKALVAVSDLDERTVLDLLETSKSFVLRLGPEYQFEHPLIRMVLYRHPSSDQRARIHADIALRLEALYKDQLDANTWQIAEHLIAAGHAAPTDKLRDYARCAAEQAASVFAWNDAARTYAAAASVTSKPAERAHLHLQAGTCYRYAWDTGPCIAQYDLAIEAFQAADYDRGIAEVLVHKARQTVRNVPVGVLADLQPYEAALELIGDEDPALRGYVLTRLSDAYSHGRCNEQAADAARQALALGEQIGDERLCNDACTFLGLAEQQMGLLEEAVAHYRRAVDHARRVGELWLENIPTQRLTLALYMSGDIASAKKNAADGLEMTRQTRYPGEECMALGGLTKLAAATGDFEETERRAQETMRAFERSRYSFGCYIALRALACARCLRGDWNGALDAIAPLIEPGGVFEKPGKWMRDSCALLTAYINGISGRRSEYSEKIQAAQRKFLGNYVGELLRSRITAYTLTEVCVAVELAEIYGMASLARAVTEPLEWALKRHLFLTHGWVFLVPRVLGCADFLAGKHDRAERRLLCAIQKAEQMELQPELARSCYDLARLLASRQLGDDMAKARRLVRRAAGIFADLGMTPWHERARRLAQDLGTRVELPAAIPQAEVFSSRELSILDQLVRGETTEGISQSLILSTRTIAAESRLLGEKIGVLPATAKFPISLTIMVTDMAKSTPMLERLGDRRGQQVIQAHDRIIRTCVRAHSGVEIRHTGDGIMASFHSVAEALGCAREIQESFRTYNCDAVDASIRVRIGIHSGEPLVGEEGLFGLAIHIAVRISDHCEPEHVLVSENVHDLAGNLGLPFLYLGRIELKGISQPVKLYKFDWRTLYT